MFQRGTKPDQGWQFTADVRKNTKTKVAATLPHTFRTLRSKPVRSPRALSSLRCRLRYSVILFSLDF